MTEISSASHERIEKACREIGVEEPTWCVEALKEKTEGQNPPPKDIFGFVDRETQTYKNYLTQVVPPCMTPAEKKLFQRINHDRYRFKDEGETKENGALPLKVDCTLVIEARRQSQKMAEHNHFYRTNDHIDPTGQSFSERAIALYRTYQLQGENFAKGNDDFFSLSNILPAHEGFMRSARGHRRAILRPDFTHAGIGIYFSPEKKMTYITERFGGAQ